MSLIFVINGLIEGLSGLVFLFYPHLFTPGADKGEAQMLMRMLSLAMIQFGYSSIAVRSADFKGKLALAKSAMIYHFGVIILTSYNYMNGLPISSGATGYTTAAVLGILTHAALFSFFLLFALKGDSGEERKKR